MAYFSAMDLSRMAYALVIVIAVAVILIYTKAVLIPFLLAFMIWFLIRQVQTLIGRIRIGGSPLPVWLRGTVAFLGIFAVLGLMAYLLTINIRGVTEVLPHYEQNVFLIKEQIESTTGLDLGAYTGKLTKDLEVGKVLSMLINALTSLLGNALLVVVYVAFLMLEERHATLKFNALHKDESSKIRTANIIRQVDGSLSHYVTLKTLISLMTGGLSYVALLIIGVDFAFFWAFVIFLLNYIPNIGSLVATIFPAFIAALQFASFGPALWVLGGVGAVQLLMGNIVEPRLMGNSLNVSAVVVILSLAFWGSIWGLVGMILSVPITVMLVIVLAQFEATRWIAVLLSDKGQVGEPVAKE